MIELLLRVGDVVKLTWQQQDCDDEVHEGYIPLHWLKHDYSDHQLNKKKTVTAYTSSHGMAPFIVTLLSTPGWAQADL